MDLFIVVKDEQIYVIYYEGAHVWTNLKNMLLRQLVFLFRGKTDTCKSSCNKDTQFMNIMILQPDSFHEFW